MSDVITIADARKAGFCVYGIREWCKIHGFNFEALVRGKGIPVEDLIATQDAMAIELVSRLRGYYHE